MGGQLSHTWRCRGPSRPGLVANDTELLYLTMVLTVASGPTSFSVAIDLQYWTEKERPYDLRQSSLLFGPGSSLRLLLTKWETVDRTFVRRERTILVAVDASE